jgi:hypothetical protein
MVMIPNLTKYLTTYSESIYNFLDTTLASVYDYILYRYVSDPYPATSVKGLHLEPDTLLLTCFIRLHTNEKKCIINSLPHIITPYEHYCRSMHLMKVLCNFLSKCIYYFRNKNKYSIVKSIGDDTIYIEDLRFRDLIQTEYKYHIKNRFIKKRIYDRCEYIYYYLFFILNFFRFIMNFTEIISITVVTVSYEYLQRKLSSLF